MSDTSTNSGPSSPYGMWALIFSGLFLLFLFLPVGGMSVNLPEEIAAGVPPQFADQLSQSFMGINFAGIMGLVALLGIIAVVLSVFVRALDGMRTIIVIAGLALFAVAIIASFVRLSSIRSQVEPLMALMGDATGGVDPGEVISLGFGILGYIMIILTAAAGFMMFTNKDNG